MNKMHMRFCALLAVCLVFSSQAQALDIGQYFDNLGKIYWQGGEDFTYDYDLEDLVPTNYYENNFNNSLGNMIPDPISAKKKRPIIAIVIDDMGVNKKMSKYTINKIVSKKVTMSYLPYAYKVQEQVDGALKRGHEVILHLPWEPDKISVDAGPNKLLVGDSDEVIKKNLIVNLNKFKGYVGVNNHMGSKFSNYRDGIEIVMEELRERNLFFLDSKTITSSIADKIAQEYSVPTTHRNVFLDHEENKHFVDAALREVERIARKTGSAVAIGHPKLVTIDGLNKWIPTLEKKGFRLVKLSKAIAKRQSVYNANATQLKKNAYNRN